MSNKAMNWAVDAEVKGSHKLVLMLLAEAHNGHTGQCFPSHAWIQKHGGLSESTVAACMKDLEDWGFLERNTQRLGRGKGSRTDYVLNFQKIEHRNLDLYNSADRTPEFGVIDPVKSGVPLKEEPEREPELTGTARAVFDHYSKEASEVGWIQHAKFTPAIEKHVNARIAEYGAENVKRFITALKAQSWTYKGFKGSPEFRASLVYICRPRTFAEHFDKLCPPEAPARRILDLHNGLTRDNWWTAVQWFYDSDGQWDLDHISPPPGQPGCLAPPDMLKEIAR